MTETMHGREEPRGLDYPTLENVTGRFGRLFPSLHGLHVPLHVLQALAGEMHDAPTPPPETPPGWGTPSPPPVEDGDNDTIPAGYTYLGQFIDHDLTFDPRSRLDAATRPENLANFRVPRLDLDSVYGGGPAVSPHLYDKQSPGKLLIGQRDGVDDLPRNEQDTALIGDPRNDENQIVSQLHLAVLKFHNQRIDGGESFQQAQQLTRWHYQWVVVHDFLRRLVGIELVHELLSLGPMFVRWPYQVFMPIEFSVGAYRFGHSQVRNRYILQPGGEVLPVFGAVGADLRGGQALTAGRQIDWAVFAEFPDTTPTPTRRIDTKLADSLFKLFGAGAEAPPGETDLALRNLRRGVVLGLPSGQAVARHMAAALTALPERAQVAVLPDDQTDLSTHGWQGEMPLWFYTLLEAQIVGEGRRLGPMGARIVAEVLLGFLEGDPTSYLASNPGWQPADDPSSFSLSAFLRMAGVHA